MRCGDSPCLDSFFSFINAGILPLDGAGDFPHYCSVVQIWLSFGNNDTALPFLTISLDIWPSFLQSYEFKTMSRVWMPEDSKRGWGGVERA